MATTRSGGFGESMMVAPMYSAGFRVTVPAKLRTSSFSFGEGFCHATTVGRASRMPSVPLWTEMTNAVVSYMDEAGMASNGRSFPTATSDA